MTNERAEVYHSYLLRVWRESNHERAVWRASLHCVQTSTWHNFPSLEQLFIFLRTQTDPGVGMEQDCDL